MRVNIRISGQQDLIAEAVARAGNPGRMLDIRGGDGAATRAFKQAGWDVAATGFDAEAYFEMTGADLPKENHFNHDAHVENMPAFEDESFDVVWCAHVLEHTLETGKALSEMRRVLAPNGQLFLSVPPFKHDVVGGHVMPGWNLGILIYILADSGFDLVEGAFVKHGDNCFACVRRGPGPLPLGELRRASGDIETLMRHGRFPRGFKVYQGYNGDLAQVNWRWRLPPVELPVSNLLPSGEYRKGALRIAIFVPWITKGRGGTENVGQMMVHALIRRGHQVEVFTFDELKEQPKFLLPEGVRLTHIAEGHSVECDEQMALEVARMNPDVLVGLHMNRTFLRYARCAKWLGLPLVLSEHIDPAYPRKMGNFDVDERDVAFSAATVIHLLAPEFLQTLPEFMRARVRLVPNTAGPPLGDARPGTDSGPLTLLTVARLVPRKGIHRLIEAFAIIAGDVPKWHLQIVGDGSEKASLEQAVRNAGIAARVEFVGQTDNPHAYYRDAHLFTLPSISEAFPMSTLEAMVHGLPVVGYSVCAGVNQQVEHGSNGLLASFGDKGSYAASLRTLMLDAAARERMGQNSLERVAQYFAPEIVEEAWEEMIVHAVRLGGDSKRPSIKNYLESQLDDYVFDRKTLLKSARRY